MNNVKKNNKGFSLVELIVVVLIMAIIAVSLAPQVMKWVNNSRIATDRQTVDSVVSYAQLALTDSKAYAEVNGTGTTIKIEDDGITLSGTEFTRAFKAAAGITADSEISFKTEGAEITITITDTCAVQTPSYTSTKLESDDLDD